MFLTTAESPVGITSSYPSQSYSSPSSPNKSPDSIQQETPSIQPDSIQQETSSMLKSQAKSHEFSHGQSIHGANSTVSQICPPLPTYFTPNPSQSSMREVLLIDPEDDVREITQAGLELTTDWKIVTAHSYPQGLEIAKSHRPHVILLNIESHKSCFIHIFRQLKENPVTQDIPVILLIDRVRLCDEQRFAQLGITAVIAKPFDCVALGQKIAYLLDW